VKPGRVASFVNALLRNRSPRAFDSDTEDAEAIRAAIELRAAQPGAAEPADEFVRELQARLRERLESTSTVKAGDSLEQPTPDFFVRRTLTRRHLLEGAGIAAAAAALGVVGDRVLDHVPSTRELSQQSLVPDNGRWVTVATGDRVAASRLTAFKTEDVVGFIVNEGGTLRATSGVCTHQGCLLKANDAASRFDCPCHGAAFSLDGRVLFHQFKGQLAPLPTLEVRQAGNEVQVLLPPPKSA